MNAIDTVYCLACRQPMPASDTVCPSCGADQEAARVKRMQATPRATAPAGAASFPDRRILVNQLIAVLQMLGGTLGLGIVVSAGTRLPALSVLVSASVFGTCIVAGVWLWQGESRGLRLSFAIQALQSVLFVVSGITYAFTAGLVLIPILILGPERYQMHISAGLFSAFHIAFGKSPTVPLTHIVLTGGTVALGINVVAIACATYLWLQVVSTAAYAPDEQTR